MQVPPGGRSCHQVTQIATESALNEKLADIGRRKQHFHEQLAFIKREEMVALKSTKDSCSYPQEPMIKRDRKGFSKGWVNVACDKNNVAKAGIDGAAINKLKACNAAVRYRKTCRNGCGHTLPEEKEAFVREHNVLRCTHGSPPVVWDEGMAQALAKKIRWTDDVSHTDALQTTPYGENVAYSSDPWLPREGTLARRQAWARTCMHTNVCTHAHMHMHKGGHARA